MLLSVAALGPFFISSISAPLFGGQIMPTRQGLGLITIAGIEGNLVNFGSSAILIGIADCFYFDVMLNLFQHPFLRSYQCSRLNDGP